MGPHIFSKGGMQSQVNEKEGMENSTSKPGYFDIDLQIESAPATPWVLGGSKPEIVGPEYSKLPISPKPLDPAHFSTASTLPVHQRAFSGYSLARSDSAFPSGAATPHNIYSTPNDSLAKLPSPIPSPLPGQGFDLELPPRPPPRPNIFKRTWTHITNHVDPRSIWQLIDIRPYFWPITLKKYLVLFVIACIIAGLVVSDLYFHWMEKSLKITRSYMLPVLIISVCAEPCIIFIILPVAKILDLPKEEIDLIMGKESGDVEVAAKKKLEPQGPFETALVIPCHDTDELSIRTTLDSAFVHFRPQDIFIVDNGRTLHPKHPTCNFRKYIQSIHPDIVYMWSPIGSKNAAQFVGSLAAKNYKYIMTVDDDVCIPKNFHAPTEMINDKFKAVAYPLKGMDAQCNIPLWLVAWQDVEYRMAGLAKLAEDRLCGVQFPHGAGWFIERDTMIELMAYHHPMDFIAEDCNAGLGLSKMGKGIRLDARSYLATECPNTFFGPGLSWWKQRQKSWEMGRHGQMLAFLNQLFLRLPANKTVQGLLWHKLTYFYLICTNIIDWLRVPTVVALGRTGTWWRNAILLQLFSALPCLVYKYVKCRRRPDLKPRFWACLTYPYYKLIYIFVALFGAIRCVMFFIGGHVKPPTIQQMLKSNDPRCFWLDPRFENSPGWLADEAEEEEMKKAEQQVADDNVSDRTVGGVPERPSATHQSPRLVADKTENHFSDPAPQNPFLDPVSQRSSPKLGSTVDSRPLLSPTLCDIDSEIPPIPLVPRMDGRPGGTALASGRLSSESQSTLVAPRSRANTRTEAASVLDFQVGQPSEAVPFNKGDI